MRKESLILALVVFVGCFQSIQMIMTPAQMAQTFIQAVTADCTLYKKTAGITYEQMKNQADARLLNCFIKLYTDNNKIVYSMNNASEGITQSTYFNPSLPTVVVVHAYLQTCETTEIVQIAKDIKSHGNVNVLAYDHSALTMENYFLASTNVQYAGEALGRVLADMYSRGVRVFHIIGFSIGAHVCAFAGKEFNKVTGVKIDRITGLDPALGCFNNETHEKKLVKSDANLVDVIHTAAGTVGITYAAGHVDFYPNAGSLMSGCFEPMSSHGRALAYFIESIKNSNGFKAVTCSNWTAFKTKTCTNNAKVSMGYGFQNNGPNGPYFLRTAGASLFALGDAGVV